jgi:hypothetical protein
MEVQPVKPTDNRQEILVPEILPPSEDGVFKSLLTHPDAKPVLCDLHASQKGRGIDYAKLMRTYPRLRSDRRKVPCENSPASGRLELTAAELSNHVLRLYGISGA